ncbi:hypothetical protein ABPG75_013900 [Micractinium tetrahymenae]
MPSPADFRRGFGLEQGQNMGKSKEWKIASLHVGHDVKEQNECYEFPTELTLEWQPGTAARGGRQQAARRAKLEAAWQAATHIKRIVYSAYGSPYECTYGAASSVSWLDEEGRSWQLRSLGTAVRRRDIPTLGQQAEEEREEQGVREVTKEEERRYLEGYRVIRSRFGSSKCSACGGDIKQGVKICKEEGDATKGGWAHATCILQERRREAGEEGGEGHSSEGDADEGGEADIKSEAREERRQEQEAGGKRKKGAATAGKQQSGIGGKKMAAASGGGSSKKAAAARGRGRKRQRTEAEE